MVVQLQTTILYKYGRKSWVIDNFDGSGSGFLDSFNVSGMTDNGTGKCTISINNDMANDQ